MKRPVIKVPYTFLDYLLSWGSLLALICMCIFLLESFGSLPETVPVHFGADGKPDSWGNAAQLWILPGIGAVLWVCLTIVEGFPHIYNFPIEITEHNALDQYKNAVRLLTFIKAEITIFFSYLIWKTVEISRDAADSLGLWSVLGFLAVVFITIGIYIWRSYNLERVKEEKK